MYIEHIFTYIYIYLYYIYTYINVNILCSVGDSPCDSKKGGFWSHRRFVTWCKGTLDQSLRPFEEQLGSARASPSCLVVFVVC